MRRHDKQIQDKQEIVDILSLGKVIRIAFSGAEPYVLPLNYGYSKGAIYIHCAPVGKKLDLIKDNPKVAFEVTIDDSLKSGETACAFGYRYRCVIGSGTAFIVEDEWEKISGLNILMKQQAGLHNPVYEKEMVDKVTVFKVIISEMTGKKSGF